MILAGTGHRPERLQGREESVIRLTRELLESLKPERVITGLAAGFDQILAVEAIDLGIPLTSAMPYKGFGGRWHPDHQEILKFILDKSDHVEVCSQSYHGGVFQIRDEWMVDNATDIAACWDLGCSGGTYNTIVYAEKVGKQVYHLQWL